VRQHTGRPYFAYRLTEKALESSSDGYARLLERLLRDAAALPDTDGRRMLLDALLEQMSDHLAEDYRARVHGQTLEERVHTLTEALRAEGILDTWEQRADGIHLMNTACPHRRAALAAHDLCGSERRAIAKLLGEDVEQVARMVDGGGCCEYVVRPRGQQLVTIQ
jgi:predicted ArsR family transcriptional regulator